MYEYCIAESIYYLSVVWFGAARSGRIVVTTSLGMKDCQIAPRLRAGFSILIHSSMNISLSRVC